MTPVAINLDCDSRLPPQKEESVKAPDCYKCSYRRNVPGDAHSCCKNGTAHVKGHPHGIGSGWFEWPLNFDPVWLLSCDGFKSKED